MGSYIIRNKNGSDVTECQFDRLMSGIREENYKSDFKSDGSIENRMYMVRRERQNICRIDAKYSPQGTFIIMSEFKEQGIEKKLVSHGDFDWFKLNI